jgi:hypothetical protein
MEGHVRLPCLKSIIGLYSLVSEKGSIEIGMTNIVLTGDLGCYYDYIVGIP